jgi:hypothetical protein
LRNKRHAVMILTVGKVVRGDPTRIKNGRKMVVVIKWSLAMMIND